MARENYRSLYSDLTKLKSTPVLNAPATVTDAELWELLLASTEAIERYCNRHFYPLTTTRYLDGLGLDSLIIPDLLSVTTLKEDDDENLSWTLAWATTDYILKPHNAEPTKHWGGPYTELAVAPGGKYATFPKGSKNFELAGKWGYRNYAEASGTTTDNAGYTAAVTTINVAAGGGAQLRIGETIRIGVEDLLITNIVTDALTVVRGINGTTATAIPASLETVSIVRWPAPIERATLIHAARLYQRAPYAEPYYEDADLDTDIRVLLDRYRALTA